MKTKPLSLIIFFMFAMLGTYAQQVVSLNSAEAKKMLESKKKLVLLDVRTAAEVSQGRIANSTNIDVYQHDAYQKIDKLDKNETYVVYCRTKNRSGMVVKYMSDHGFKSVYQMMEGFAGWSANNFPIVK